MPDSPGHRLTVARWLLRHGAGASARLLLGNVPGREANRLRLQADEAVLVPGVYGLVRTDEGTAFVLPIEPVVGAMPHDTPEALRSSVDAAMQAVRERLGLRSLPALHPSLHPQFRLVGDSLGLAVYLAFLRFFAPSAFADSVVLATGALGPGDSILPIGFVREKIEAAFAERGATVVLVPDEAGTRTRVRGVRTRSEAERVAASSELFVDPRFASFDEVLASARLLRDEGCIAWLEAIDASTLLPLDAIRRSVVLGAAYRHIGDPAKSKQVLEVARERGSAIWSRMGPDERANAELQLALSTLNDFFDVDAAIEVLERSLRAGLPSVGMELRFRGALAQALSMAGRYREAYETRRVNVELHGLGQDLARIEAGTQCYLALDAARLGDSGAFDTHVARMYEATSPGDENQLAYDAAVYVRGSVFLGRHQEAVDFCEGRGPTSRAFRCRSLARTFSEGQPIGRFPDSSTLRAYARACRRLGDAERARAVVLRGLTSADAPLARFVDALCRLEVELGAGPEPSAAATSMLETLATLHPSASRHHGFDRAATTEELEKSIDSVWY